MTCNMTTIVNREVIILLISDQYPKSVTSKKRDIECTLGYVA